MATYNPANTANTVFGIAGMGISLGLLARTANSIAQQTENIARPARSTYRRKKKRPRLAYKPPRHTPYRIRTRYW